MASANLTIILFQRYPNQKFLHYRFYWNVKSAKLTELVVSNLEYFWGISLKISIRSPALVSALITTVTRNVKKLLLFEMRSSFRFFFDSLVANDSATKPLT